MSFFAQLEARSRSIDSLLCVGLDPDHAHHRVEDVAPYLLDIVAATAPYAACYKPNLAFFEQWGVEGLKALERVLSGIPGDIPTIGDAKRGDIGNTAAAYARALFEAWGFGAATVNPYLGRDAVDPFLAYSDRGVFVLCRTSNPGAGELQAQELANGRRLFEHVAATAPGWGANVGLVVGATASAELACVRQLAPQTPLLIPGVGAQGGPPEDAVRFGGYRPGKVLVNSSRGVIYAGSGPGAIDAAAAAARALRDTLRNARDDHRRS